MSDIVERLLATGYTVIDARNKVRYRQTLAVCQDAVDEITRLRSQVAEQEATIRRLQNRASKDAETFSALKREAVEAEREACAKVAEEMPPMRDFSPAHIRATTPRDVATAIRNRTTEGER